MSDTLKIVTLPGDGIGIEVMREGRKLLDAALETCGLRSSVEEIEGGGQYYLKHGTRDWPEGAEEKCAAADVIFLGAVGWPDPKTGGPVTMANGKMAGYGPVIGNRVALELYANVRPVKLYPGVTHRIHDQRKQVWEAGKVDITFVRENTEGLYSGIGGYVKNEGRRIVAIDNRIITRPNAERVIRHAFEIAKKRPTGAPVDGKRRVTAIVKDNVLDGCRFFRDIFFEIARDYPGIEAETSIVDAFTQWLIAKPEWYQVCVTTNMFGDIVTDLASVLQGGMGMAVGCNVGDRHAMFEPIHGSAPKHSGKDRANPFAMILAVKEGLVWVGEKKKLGDLVRVASKIEDAVASIIADGKPLTYDLAGEKNAAKASEVGNAVRERFLKLAR